MKKRLLFLSIIYMMGTLAAMEKKRTHDEFMSSAAQRAISDRHQDFTPANLLEFATEKNVICTRICPQIKIPPRIKVPLASEVTSLITQRKEAPQTTPSAQATAPTRPILPTQQQADTSSAIAIPLSIGERSETEIKEKEKQQKLIAAPISKTEEKKKQQKLSIDVSIPDEDQEVKRYQKYLFETFKVRDTLYFLDSLDCPTFFEEEQASRIKQAFDVLTMMKKPTYFTFFSPQVQTRTSYYLGFLWWFGIPGHIHPQHYTKAFNLLLTCNTAYLTNKEKHTRELLLFSCVNHDPSREHAFKGLSELTLTQFDKKDQNTIRLHLAQMHVFGHGTAQNYGAAIQHINELFIDQVDHQAEVTLANILSWIYLNAPSNDPFMFNKTLLILQKIQINDFSSQEEELFARIQYALGLMYLAPQNINKSLEKAAECFIYTMRYGLGCSRDCALEQLRIIVKKLACPT